jgi:CheY-like chemotaxis protein
MITCEQFEHELQKAATHLYDPTYQVSAAFCTLMGCNPQNGALTVQSAIIQAIEALEPEPTTPPSARTCQIYALLYSRFVLKLTREETAISLHMSVTSIKRLQREAVHTLARVLWERNRVRDLTDDGYLEQPGTQQIEDETPELQAPSWSSQTKRALASLQASAPDAVSDVERVINGVLELMSVLAAEHSVDVEIGFVQQGLVAAVHPSVLRQVLITALGRLAQYTATGQIAIYAGLEDGNVNISLTGPVTSQKTPTESDLVHDLLAPEDISVEACVDDGHVFLWLKLPSTGKITVLAVDDNPDMIRFYRRSTEGTSYRIVHISRGQDLFEAVKATAPDVILLDVILPDVDGWELLMHLHEHPVSRWTPVIVCTVVREENLALSLGAALHLSKPLQPRQLIRALDQVLEQSRGHNATGD